MDAARAWIRLLRPRHWLKNVFVLMPLPFAIALGAQAAPEALALGLAAFCLAASSVYAANDAIDAARDRLHPAKRMRPVAAGEISRAAASITSAALAAGALGLAALAERGLAVELIAIYLALNALYSTVGRRVPLLDVFLLASGFVVRVLFGCALLEVPPSSWLLLCSSTLALFIALAKRRADLRDGLGRQHRGSLGGYSQSFLEFAMVLCAGVTLLAYALWCMDAAALRDGRELISLPFVFFGVLEYLRLALVHDAGGSPVDVLSRSPVFAACGAGWALTVAWSLV